MAFRNCDSDVLDSIGILAVHQNRLCVRRYPPESQAPRTWQLRPAAYNSIMRAMNFDRQDRNQRDWLAGLLVLFSTQSGVCTRAMVKHRGETIENGRRSRNGDRVATLTCGNAQHAVLLSQGVMWRREQPRHLNGRVLLRQHEDSRVWAEKPPSHNP
eukprot:TRINITY_DN56909_c0_g1_i1.p2 TRINITY_DN56909_c0_g1~~TRINITY_DN56909_c0_g1_i1.p2  ORF type:complete len:178 (-),score=16.07 TRINITY_DN56909_c0_g1_i1:16-486(-)